MALPAHSSSMPLTQFHNFSQTVGILGRIISPSQDRYLNTGQHKHRHPCLEWDSTPLSQRPRASEDSSCLRARGYCDRLMCKVYCALLTINLHKCFYNIQTSTCHSQSTEPSCRASETCTCYTEILFHTRTTSIDIVREQVSVRL
jgi:hypothetical protein